ncbi:unnamed protein product [Zymoseptoria tritici ST99CH_3D7]|uniref:LYC1 C-terminal domain-containing protein n=1 Tax=Zymoseptoria tritici (strain ST99CH_3D7) TaxID=1276538 RepID=A0A1X7S489_ZYMT9|nr:unnamed protein product [Zymoseptoria tritici ST99CH_3D7]
MGSMGLPCKDSADLYLVEATPEESHAQLISNSLEWRGPLNLEQYIQRETLAEQELEQDGLTRWMLVYQPNANGPRQVLCGCETFKKKALVGKDGTVEDVISHGIGSVFCPPEFRGKGYAGRMITDLGERLKTWQVEQGKQSPFSILYSDIGKDFYRIRGWQLFPSAHVTLPSRVVEVPANVKLLQSEDLPELCMMDEKLLRKAVAESTSGKTKVALVPGHGTLLWHLSRQKTVANTLYKKTPSIHGAMVGNIQGSRVWACWTRVWAGPEEESPSTLHILRLVIEDESFSDFTAASPEGVAKLQDSQVVRDIDAIFQVAQTEAYKWDMGEVLLWNPSSAALAAAQRIESSAEVVHREKESIASLRWYGSGSWEDVQWLANEKYGWC